LSGWTLGGWTLGGWTLGGWTLGGWTLGHWAARHWAARHRAGCDGFLGSAQHADQRLLLDRHFNFLRVIRNFDFFAGLTVR
jgi:hypothetical protein